MAGGPQPDLLLLVGAEEYDGTQKRLQGNADIHKLLGPAVPYARFALSGQTLRHSRTADLSGYRTILNLVTDADQNPTVLENAAKMLRGVPARVLNHPRTMLGTTRDKVARRLAGTPGLQVPRVLRLPRPMPDRVADQVARAGLSWPLILRRAGTHTGRIIGLFANADDLATAVAGERDLIATEFVDFRSPDGHYRKYRVFFIGDGIVLRHMLASDAWNVHAGDRTRYLAERPDLRAEQAALFERPTEPFDADLMATLGEVRRRMGLDIFGIDFAILADGRALLFEANATMNFFPFLADPRFEYLQRCIPPARAALLDLVDVRARPTVTAVGI